MPSVSILIPMHEEEAVAAQILKSFVHMDYPKEDSRFEVIVIDDNSKDATSSIVDEYASKYRYITVINRIENGGSGNNTVFAIDDINGYFQVTPGAKGPTEISLSDSVYQVRRACILIL